MNETNYIKLEFPSKSCNEAFARTAAAAFAAQLDPTLEELGDIKTAVFEAVTNAIVHGYPDTLGRIAMRLRIIKGNTLEISSVGTGNRGDVCAVFVSACSRIDIGISACIVSGKENFVVEMAIVIGAET